jgi:alpha-beta hydrolase superfamily lysophospholipase
MVENIASIVSADGYRLQYRVWPTAKVPASSPRADVVLLNGVMSHSGWFGPLAEPLGKRGFKVIGADRRGTGVNMAARGDAPSAETLIEDAIQIIEAERTEDRPLYLVGWCWGAVLAINVASLMEDELAGLALLAPGLHPTEALKSRMEAQQKSLAARADGEASLASPITEEMFTQGPYLENFILKDDLRLTAFTSRFHRIMSRMGMSAALRLRRLKLPILLVLADEDLATENQETVRTFERIESTRARIAWCKGAHGLQFDAAEELLNHLVSWMDENR